jgi:internalin A
MSKAFRALAASLCFLALTGYAALAEPGTPEAQATKTLHEWGVQFWYEQDSPAHEAIELELIREPRDEVSVKDFAPLRQLRSLRKAKLTGPPIDDAYVDYLCGCSNLETVEFVDTRITDKGLEALSKLKKLRQLTLAFSPRITDRGIRHLSKVANLEILVLTDIPNVTGPGLIALQSTTRLRELDLSWTPITDEGVRTLAKHPALRRLVLEDCPISDESLTSVSGMPRIERLMVDGTKVTKAGLDALRKTRPGLVVEH